MSLVLHPEGVRRLPEALHPAARYQALHGLHVELSLHAAARRETWRERLDATGIAIIVCAILAAGFAALVLL